MSGKERSSSDEAGHLAESGAEAVKDRVRGQKDVAADQIGSVARAANRAADEFSEACPHLASYTRQAAERAETFSHDLRERSLGHLLKDANAFARREPVAFFGAAVAAGFALSRFMKSSADHHDSKVGAAGSPGSTTYSSSPDSTPGSTYGAGSRLDQTPSAGGETPAPTAGRW